MRYVLIGLAAMLAGLAADIQAASAQRGNRAPRPFCLRYSIFDTGNTMDCSYYTYQQCYETARGLDAYCIENPAIAWAQREQQQQRRRWQERY
jgi:hypothetical protein